MKEKLWSPGKARKVWIIWYEDMDGQGDKHVFAHKIEAGERLAELLRDVVDDNLADVPDPLPHEDVDPVGTLVEIKREIDRNPWGALSMWEEFHEAYGTSGTINVEEATLFGA